MHGQNHVKFDIPSVNSDRAFSLVCLHITWQSRPWFGSTWSDSERPSLAQQGPVHWFICEFKV